MEEHYTIALFSLVSIGILLGIFFLGFTCGACINYRDNELLEAKVKSLDLRIFYLENPSLQDYPQYDNYVSPIKE